MVTEFPAVHCALLRNMCTTILFHVKNTEYNGVKLGFVKCMKFCPCVSPWEHRKHLILAAITFGASAPSRYGWGSRSPRF